MSELSIEQQKAKLDELVTGLADDLRDEVVRIEASIATTQYHYGQYGSLLSSVSKGNKRVAQLCALACIKAGANREGVANGLRFFVTGE